MYTTFSKSKVALLACLVAVAFAGVASAYPNQGGTCTGCHSDGASGNMTLAPNPVNVQLSTGGLLTFTVTGVPTGNTAISVGFTDATTFGNLTATGGNLTWTKRTNSGNRFTSSSFTANGTYTLNLAAAVGSPLTSSALTLYLASTNALATSYSSIYNLNIKNDVIPEPASLGLFLLGTVATFFRRGRKA